MSHKDIIIIISVVVLAQQPAAIVCVPNHCLLGSGWGPFHKVLCWQYEDLMQVLETEEYQQWMAGFGSSVKHVQVNSKPMPQTYPLPSPATLQVGTPKFNSPRPSSTHQSLKLWQQLYTRSTTNSILNWLWTDWHRRSCEVEGPLRCCSNWSSSRAPVAAVSLLKHSFCCARCCMLHTKRYQTIEDMHVHVHPCH